MPGLVQVNVPALLRHIAQICKSYPAVAAAYLFGSARGRLRPDSDVDVAMVLRDAPTATGWEAFALPVELASALGRWEGHPFEVTVLSLDDAIFAMAALQGAELAYVADPDAHTHFLEDVAQRYRRDAYRYWEAVREVNGWDARPTTHA